MRQLFIFVWCLFVLNTTDAQIYFLSENDIRLQEKEMVPTLSAYTQCNLTPENGKWGWSIFALATKGWGEVLPGLWYSPAQGVQIGLATGLESAGKTWRLSPSFIKLPSRDPKTFFDHCLFKAIYEKGAGKENYWYHISNEYFYENWSYGIMFRREYGLGPMVAMKLHGIDIKIAPLYDMEHSEFKPMLGLSWECF